jgi:uncharacterized protein (DUF58 family)
MQASQVTGRFLTLAVLAYMIILAGLITLTGSLLALALPLVVYLGATLLTPAPQLQLHVERKVSVETVLEDSEVTVSLQIVNLGPALDEIVIEDRLPQGITLVEGQTRLLTSLPPKGEANLVYKVRGPRGYFALSDIQVSAWDHLGVQRTSARYATREHITFLPRITRLRRVAIRPQRTHGHFGPIPSRQTGSGIDFYGLREYQLGDPRRWINWRASARHDQALFVNQFEQERIADVGIILDARQQSNIVLENGESLFEYSVKATGALSEALLNDGNRVGLLIYGFGLERTFPGYGKVQQERILYALGQARVGHNFALESLGYLPTRFFPAGSQIVMVSPLMSGDLPAFTRLRATGYEVLVVSPDPVELEARANQLQGDLAWQIARIERVLMLRRLQRMGVRVVDWPVHRSFEPIVRATLNRVSVGRRLGLRGSL